MSSLDITKARGQFPALNEPQIYFDNAGGSQTLGTVIDSITNYLSKTNVQMGSAYTVGLKSQAIYKAGYEAAAQFVNASPSEIVLGSSTTQLFRNLSFALDFPAGSELILSKIDHEANISPWVSLAARQNLTIKWWIPKTKENPKLEASDLKDLLSEKTVLVTCTHASNILGTIHDIKAIAEAVHTVPGALLCVDAVAYAPHRQIDVKALGVDFYSFSWYKVYGPHMSLFYASPSGLDRIQTLGHYFHPTTTLEYKLGLATSSYELVSSLPSIVAYFGPSPSATWAAIEAHESELQTLLLAFLNAHPRITVLGETSVDTGKRVCTVAFVVEGWEARGLVDAAYEATGGRMGIRWGAFYSERLVGELLGLALPDGVVRVSMVHYNTVDEVKELVKVLTSLLDAIE